MTISTQKTVPYFGHIEQLARHVCLESQGCFVFGRHTAPLPESLPCKQGHPTGSGTPPESGKRIENFKLALDLFQTWQLKFAKQSLLFCVQLFIARWGLHRLATRILGVAPMTFMMTQQRTPTICNPKLIAIFVPLEKI